LVERLLKRIWRIGTDQGVGLVELRPPWPALSS